MTLTRIGSRLAALGACVLSLAAAAQAQQTYRFTVDTSSLSSQTGFLFLQFNKGNASALDATCDVLNVMPDASVLATTATLSGGASGLLPGGASFLNNNATATYLLQGITYGTSFSFDAAFSGPALGNTGPAGSLFAFSVLDANQNGLLTSDPNGTLLDVNLNQDGTLTTSNFSTNGVATITRVPGAVVPEPGPLPLLALGTVLLGVGANVRRARRA